VLELIVNCPFEEDAIPGEVIEDEGKELTNGVWKDIVG